MIKHKAMELVAALRSGDYVQGKGYLQQATDNASCLGVACLLTDQEKKPVDDMHYFKHFNGFLPAQVCDLFGFTSMVGMRLDKEKLTFPGGRSYFSLAHANDGGASFTEIANYIENNWEQL